MSETEYDVVRERNKRISFLAMCLLAFVAALAVRFFYWQVLRQKKGDLDGILAEIYTQEIWYRPQRGCIFDATGHLLAIELTNYALYCRPCEIQRETERIELARKLAPLLGIPGERILTALRENTEKKYLRLAFDLPESTAKSIAGQVEGVYAEPEPSRAYPEGPLAAHVLGFVAKDRKGYYGIEAYYNEALTGTVGYEKIEDNRWGGDSWSYTPASDGADLVLNINCAIQREAEKKLRQAIQAENAKGGTIIVMDPKTGAILAMVSYPSYDPNRYAETPRDLFRNPAISEQYEPGSVFKIITMAAALDAGEVRPDSTYVDNNYIIVGGRTIRNSIVREYGRVNMTDLLVYSLNVGAATLSTKLRADRFYEYVKAFGFGEPTGVDLAGEVAGTVHIPGDPMWSESDLGTNSFGQGIAVTPLQMLNAVAAVANGGVLMKPYIVQEIRRGDQVETVKPQAIRRVISEATARELSQMLVDTIKRGCPNAVLAGYPVAGKTGTAQIPIPGGYDTDPQAIIASFVGYFPADDPKLIILIKVDRPQQGQWATTVAAPVFRDLAQRLCMLLDIPPTGTQLVSMQPVGR